MISLQCVEAFSLANLRKNKTMRGMGPKVDNIYTVGAGSLQMVSEPCPSQKCGPHTRGRVCP